MLASHLEERLLSQQASGSQRGSRLALVVISAVAFMVGLDVTITNVAAPAIGAGLNASTSDLQWIIDSYNIAIAGLLLLGAALGEYVSRKWVFLTGLVLFLAGTLGAGLSFAIGPLVAARTVQGVGAALLLAPAMSLIAQIFPPDKRGRAITWWATAGALGTATGPIAGGIIIESLSWHWVFFLNIPILLICLALGVRVLPPGRGDVQGRIDILGAVLSVLGFALLLGGLIEGPRWSWSLPVLAAIATGSFVVAAFVIWELRQTHPLFDVRVLRNRPVTAAALALFVTYVGFTGMLFLVPQHLQGVDGYGVMVIGLALIPFALVFWLVARFSSRLTRRFGNAWTLIFGLVAMVLGFGILALAAGTSNLMLVVAATCASAAGWGLTIPVGSVVILNGLPASQTGSAAGTSMFSRYAGAAVGVALLGTALGWTYRLSLQPTLESLGTSLPAGANGSLQQTMSVAAKLSEPARTTLESAAQAAFIQGSIAAYLVGLVVSLLCLVACVLLLPLRATRH